MSQSSRIVIVGGGIAGLATAWWLGRHQARRVILVEGEPEWGQHSTGRNASILRTAISDTVTRTLATETRAFLTCPPTGFASAPLIHRCGLVVVTPTGPDPSWLLPTGSDVDELTEARFAKLSPHFHPSRGRAFHFPSEGRLHVPRLTRALAQGAREAGVELRTGTPVSQLLLRSDRVHGVQLASGEELEADWTVLAAGGWAGRLGGRVGSRVSLAPTRRHIGVSTADNRVDPDWPIVWSDVDRFYARPENGGLLLSSCDQSDVDPDHCEADAAVREQIVAATERHIRLAGGARRTSLARFWAGQRTLTHDQRFVVGPDGDVPGLFWVAGLGGHGITTSLATGRIAAEQLLGRPSRDSELRDALSPGRPAARGLQPS